MLAMSIANELNDELTVILNSVRCNLPGQERMDAVEQASLRCVVLARRLQAFACRGGQVRRPAPLWAILERDAA